jgi:transcriptional regulator with XRE-family HTH domain
MTIGEKIKTARENKKFSQQYISEQIPMNQSNYSKIERDLQEPNLFQLKRIVEILEIDINDLLQLSNDTVTSNEIDFAKEIKTVYKKYFKK